MEKAKNKILQGVMSRLGIKGKELLLLLLGGVAVVCIGCMYIGGGTTEEASLVAVSTQLEERLASTLSQIKGAGKVRVMVTYSSEEEENSGWFSSSTKENKSQVVGVIIVAQGAGDIGVTFELITAARVVLGVKASAVKVFVMDDT